MEDSNYYIESTYSGYEKASQAALQVDSGDSVEVIKKAEFVLLTDDGTYYEFLFKKKPSGLMEIEAGTRVTVTYNGDISEDNIISGGIISIETQ